MKARDVMTQPVISVEPETPVHVAIRLMLQRKVSGLPVVKPCGTLVGISCGRPDGRGICGP